jgi:hypothetical protein
LPASRGVSSLISLISHIFAQEQKTPENAGEFKITLWSVLIGKAKRHRGAGGTGRGRDVY